MTEKKIREDIKRKLSRYNSLSLEREQLEEQLIRLETIMTAPRVGGLDGMPRGSTNDDPMTRFVAELEDLRKKYKEKLTQITSAQNAVESAIQDLEPTERRLMRFRYLDGMVWEQVCVEMNYSWRQTHRIHGRILDKLVAAEMDKEGTL